MRILIIGGTQFVGRHIVEAALKNGHEITLFNRGKTNPDLFPELEIIRGDRTSNSDVEKIATRDWDLTIDCCAYHPKSIQITARALKGRTRKYIFLSSCSVYKDFAQIKIDENASTVSTKSAADLTDSSPQTYGVRKRACEQSLLEVMPKEGIVLRPGLIVGPWDTTWRFPYWIDRILFGGEILSPGSPHDPVQFIDARDLARFAIHLGSTDFSGIFNTVGPNFNLTFGQMLQEMRRFINPEASLRWVGEEFLLNLEVEPWTHLPLWLPQDKQGLFRIDDSRARKCGLQSSPIADTIRDTKDWMIDASSQPQKNFGLSLERETQLLKMWPQ